jgi:hypothetical protein
MKKTNNILHKFMRLYVEQTEAPEADQLSDVQIGQKPNDVISSNEKYLIKLLTNAFIFSPEKFDKSKQGYISNKIKNINSLINVPISKVVDEIKSIISMDNSLKVESKTNVLLNSYFNLVEQIADGTEPQPDSKEDIQLTNKQEPVEDEKEENSISLEEIFPLYKELMLKSLKHTPTEDELMILKPVADQFGEIDPLKIVTTIKNLLSKSLEDKEIKDNLSNA